MEECCLLFLVHAHLTSLYSLGNGATHRGLGSPTSVNHPGNPSQIDLQANLIWANPQLRFPSQMTLDCIRLTIRANQDPIAGPIALGSFALLVVAVM